MSITCLRFALDQLFGYRVKEVDENMAKTLFRIISSMTNLLHAAGMPQGSTRQSDQAFTLLKNEIVKCRLAPGAHFSEAELSQRYGLARAATRAALVRLADVRLVQPVPRHGFIVTPISLSSIRELFQLRLIAEPQATALAVGTIDLVGLREINQSPRLAGNDEAQLAFVKSNRDFHRAIAEATGNGRLCHLLETIADEMERLVHLGLFGPKGSDAERRDADAQHEALIAAFEDGDKLAAEACAKLHIQHAQSLVMTHILDDKSGLALN
jgi:DNA-binding GntR family transcriptional regulator